MKEVVAAFNQEKALVGAFSVIVQPVVEPMDRFAALVVTATSHLTAQRHHHGTPLHRLLSANLFCTHKIAQKLVHPYSQLTWLFFVSLYHCWVGILTTYKPWPHTKMISEADSGVSITLCLGINII